MFNMLSGIILYSISFEKDTNKAAKHLIEDQIKKEVKSIVNECIEQELIAEEFDQMIDKIVEMDIWRESVLDFQIEEEAC
jgi:transposase